VCDVSDVDQGWESDTGPEWEDEFDDNSWGEEYDERDDDDYSEPDQPYCFACYDSGWIFQFDRDDKARVCRACHPTRFQTFRWRVVGWFNRVRYRRRWNNEEGPF
jgi:hypothetical protein